MRLGGRLSAAIEVLADIEARRRPAGDALKDWGLSHRFAGSGDRAAIGNLVYDLLRWRRSSAWLADSDEPGPALWAMLGERWGMGREDLINSFEGDRFAPEQPPIAPARDLAEAPPDVRADVPEWLVGDLEAAFGEAWAAEGAASALRPPLDLRVNRLKADPDKTAAALKRFGVTPTPHAPDGLRIAATARFERHPNIQNEPPFRKGWCEVQDEGSQLAARLAGAMPGEKLLDLCAGAGGKTLALAAAMENKGQIFATDIDRARLAPIHERLKRAGTRNVQVHPPGADLGDFAGKLDAVLIDAPCTGTGTWRRRPDAKWRLRDRAVAARIGEQAPLLNQAAGLVRPGGRVVYVTCSFLPSENTGQADGFLKRHGAFTARSGDNLMATLGLSEQTAYATKQGVLMTPGRTGTDGFFVAVLERKA